MTVAAIQPWINSHESVQIYLQKINANKTRAAVSLYLYCKWATQLGFHGDVTPEKLLTLKDGFANSDAERLLDKFSSARQMVLPLIEYLGLPLRLSCCQLSARERMICLDVFC